LRRAVRDGRLQQLGHAELIGVVGARTPRRRHLAHLGRGVVEHLGQLDPGLAVDAAVVRLGVVGDLAVLEAVDDVHLPQRAAAVEQRGVQPRDQRVELLHRPGAAQGRAAHVVVEIDIVVLDPHRIGQLEGHLRELAVEQAAQVHALADQRLHVLVVVALVAFRQLEQHEAADVHRRLRRFEMQEGRVHAAQMIHRLSP
jgi:hypothetical protein